MERLTIALTFLGAFLKLLDCKIYERCELARELRDVHGVPTTQLPTWLCIANHESHFNTSAMNHGSGDHGIFQISELFWCSPPGRACGVPCELLRDEDLEDDVICAQRIHREHTYLSGDGFTAWVVYNLHCKNQQYVQTMLEGCFDDENAIKDSDKYEFYPEDSYGETTTMAFNEAEETAAPTFAYFWQNNIDRYFPGPTRIPSYFHGQDSKERTETRRPETTSNSELRTSKATTSALSNRVFDTESSTRAFSAITTTTPSTSYEPPTTTEKPFKSNLIRTNDFVRQSSPTTYKNESPSRVTIPAFVLQKEKIPSTVKPTPRINVTFKNDSYVPSATVYEETPSTPKPYSNIFTTPKPLIQKSTKAQFFTKLPTIASTKVHGLLASKSYPTTTTKPNQRQELKNKKQVAVTVTATNRNKATTIQKHNYPRFSASIPYKPLVTTTTTRPTFRTTTAKPHIQPTTKLNLVTSKAVLKPYSAKPLNYGRPSSTPKSTFLTASSHQVTKSIKAFSSTSSRPAKLRSTNSPKTGLKTSQYETTNKPTRSNLLNSAKGKSEVLRKHRDDLHGRFKPAYQIGEYSFRLSPYGFQIIKTE